jgi:hypothetical protein
MALGGGGVGDAARGVAGEAGVGSGAGTPTPIIVPLLRVETAWGAIGSSRVVSEIGGGAATAPAGAGGWSRPPAVIIVPLKRAAWGLPPIDCPHAGHALACSVTSLPQCGQNAMVSWRS